MNINPLPYYQSAFAALENTLAVSWLEHLPQQITAAFDQAQHGHLPDWWQHFQQLPSFHLASVSLDQACVSAGVKADLSDAQREVLQQQLMRWHPWRKGPYAIGELEIDTEWRSDWKWDRLKQVISPLHGRTVLDVGCGNGYHCWRMLGAGAKQVFGIDPTMLSVLQFLVMKHFLGTQHPAWVLPLGIEALPAQLRAFDTVFSMGVLYHRRSPLDHLLELRDSLRPDGELVLETLVIDGAMGEVLVPEGRYAKMRNVWFIPSPATLLSWLKRCGFVDIRLVDVTTTSLEEQRSTAWMQFESLADFLDPDDVSRTAEGLPAPRRAVVIARTRSV